MKRLIPILIIIILSLTGCSFTYEDENIIEASASSTGTYKVHDINGVIKVDNPSFKIKLNKYKGTSSKVIVKEIKLDCSGDTTTYSPNIYISEGSESDCSLDLAVSDSSIGQTITDASKGGTTQVDCTITLESVDTTSPNRKVITLPIIYSYSEENILISVTNEPKFIITKNGSTYDIDYPEFTVNLENYESGIVKIKKIELTYDSRKHVEPFVVINDINFYVQVNEPKVLTLSEVVTDRLVQNLVNQTSFVETVGVKFYFTDKYGNDLMSINKTINYVLIDETETTTN